jgi:hypothetical protein
MASPLRESASPWTWVLGLILATTLPMTASFILVRLGLNHWYRVTQPPSPTSPVAPPQADVIPAGTRMQVTAPEGLLVRAQPQAQSPVVGTAAYQQTIERLAMSADQQWEQVRLPAQQVVGWVKAGNLQAPSPVHPPPVPPQGNVWVTAEDGLILRQEPSTSAPVITGLAYAQELIFLAHNGDASWTQVQIPATQTTGWVKSEYVRSTPPGEREGRQVQVNSPTGLVLRREHPTVLP